MKGRFSALLLAALVVGLLSCTVAGAAMIGIYRNSLESLAQRSQLVKLAGANCARAGVGDGMRITLGKKTASCSFRTPVLGRDLEIAATERLLSGTPENLQRKAFLGLELRAGEEPSTSCWSSRVSARHSWSRSPLKARNISRSPKTSRP